MKALAASPPVATQLAFTPEAPAPVAASPAALDDDMWDTFQCAAPGTGAPAEVTAPAAQPVVAPAAPAGQPVAAPVALAAQAAAAPAAVAAAPTALADPAAAAQISPAQATAVIGAAAAPAPVLAPIPAAPAPEPVLDAFDPFAWGVAAAVPPAEHAPLEKPLFDASELDLLAAPRATAPLPASPVVPVAAVHPVNEFDPLALEAPMPSPASSPPRVAAVPAPAAANQALALHVAGGLDLLGLGGDNPSELQPDEPVCEAAPPDPEDDGKKVIYVFHKGEKNVIGWYSDATKSDIREAVQCACDAIMDGGFVLREVTLSGDGDDQAAEPKEDGRVYVYESFQYLKHGQTYILESAMERNDLKNITGDRWRRLKVPIEPFLHVEAQKAVERLRRGSNLLKHTSYGFPHLRQFQLSDDLRRLVWYTGAKRKENSVIQLEDVREIRLGQATQVFMHYRLPMLEHLSFSLIYGGKTLDLTCKDEFEFDNWVTGLKAIFCYNKGRHISKEQLLGHSKRFRKALEKSNTGIKLTKLPEVKEKGQVGLEDCIEIASHTPAQLEKKVERLHEKLRTTSQQVARLDHHAAAEAEVDLSVLTGQGPAYASVYARDEEAQDQEMEIRTMHELVEGATSVMQQARSELSALTQARKDLRDSTAEAKAKRKEASACKHIDQLLWKVEVDLENVEDMFARHLDSQKDTTMPFSISMVEINITLHRSLSDIKDTLKSNIDEIRTWF